MAGNSTIAVGNTHVSVVSSILPELVICVFFVERLGLLSSQPLPSIVYVLRSFGLTIVLPLSHMH